MVGWEYASNRTYLLEPPIGAWGVRGGKALKGSVTGLEPPTINADAMVKISFLRSSKSAVLLRQKDLIDVQGQEEFQKD